MINMVRIHRPNVWPGKKRLVYGQSEARSTFSSCLICMYIYLFIYVYIMHILYIVYILYIILKIKKYVLN